MNTYGLIGRKLKHSFSADYFNTKFKKEALDSVYKLFEIENIESVFNILEFEPKLKGLNVTIPYKEAILPFLYTMDKTTKEVGAVNTIKIIDKKLYGFNTDVIGFEQLLTPFLENRNLKALVFGSGGASKSVAYVLKNKGIPYKTISRSQSNGDLIWNEITPALIKDYPLLINTTPLGMEPNIHTFPALPYDYITANHIAIDLIYNPETTLFLKKCQQQKAKIANGLPMLFAQAEAAWEIWNRKSI